MKNPDQNFQVCVNLMRKFEATGVEYSMRIDAFVFYKKLEKYLNFIGEYTRNFILKNELIVIISPTVRGKHMLSLIFAMNVMTLKKHQEMFSLQSSQLLWEGMSNKGLAVT